MKYSTSTNASLIYRASRYLCKFKKDIPNTRLCFGTIIPCFSMSPKLPSLLRYHAFTLQHPDLACTWSNGSLHHPMQSDLMGYGRSSSPPAKVIAQTYVCSTSTATNATRRPNFFFQAGYQKSFPTVPKHWRNSAKQPHVRNVRSPPPPDHALGLGLGRSVAFWGASDKRAIKGNLYCGAKQKRHMDSAK